MRESYCPISSRLYTSKSSTDDLHRNGNETFAAYKAAVAKAKNVPAANVKGGVMGSISAAHAVSPSDLAIYMRIETEREPRCIVGLL